MKYRPVPPFLQIRQFVQAVETHGLLGAIGDFHKRLFRSFKDRGLGGTLRRLSSKGRPSVKIALPTKPHPFDLHHGTNTGGYISGSKVSAISLSAIYTVAYYPTTPSALKQAIAALPIKHDEFTFVDLGCGMGRALMVAAQFPFRNLLGVELSKEFCEIARTNIATVPKHNARISIVNQDATTVTYPNGPLLLFLFDPFAAPVLKRVLKSLECQLRRLPRPAYILYEWNPRTRGVTRAIRSCAFLNELSDTAYPFSPEDVAHDHFGRIEERFTLYSAGITH